MIDGIRQAQCLAVAVTAASCSKSGGPQQGAEFPIGGQAPPPPPRWRQRWCVHVGRTQTAAKLVRGSQNAIVSEVKRRQAVQRHLYKLARLAYSRHGAEPAANGSPSKPE